MGIFSLWADSGVVVTGDVVGEGDLATGCSWGAGAEGELGRCDAAAEAASHTLLLAASSGGADAWTDMLLGAVRKHKADEKLILE